MLVAVVFGPTSVCVGLGQATSTSRRLWAFRSGYLRFLEGLREDFSFQEPRTVAKFEVWEQEKFRLSGSGWRRSKFHGNGNEELRKSCPPSASLRTSIRSQDRPSATYRGRVGRLKSPSEGTSVPAPRQNRQARVAQGNPARLDGSLEIMEPKAQHPTCRPGFSLRPGHWIRPSRVDTADDCRGNSCRG